MTFGKASALACGFVGATAFGIWLSPHVMHERAISAGRGAAAVESPAPEDEQHPVPAAQGGNAAAPRRPTSAPAVPASEPLLHQRLKPLLNGGADMNVASAGFRSGEQFAALAHAARNTDVPFMLLKYRVLDERKTLRAAIHESKPHMDASIEANRAIAEAKSDIAALTSVKFVSAETPVPGGHEPIQHLSPDGAHNLTTRAAAAADGIWGIFSRVGKRFPIVSS